MQDQTLECDVVVVGARCAGAATAMLLAAAGHEVVVLDRAAVPSDTLSTHGMARGAVVQLARWGLLDRVLATGATTSRQVTFGVGGEEVTRPVKDCSGVDLLLAPRRHVLDALLGEAAVGAGARLLERTAVVDVLRAGDRVTGVIARTARTEWLRVRARYVVGADGLRSTVARLVGAAASRCFWSDSSTFYTYVDGVEWHGFEFHVADQAFAGVFPSHGDQACVWLIRPEPALAPVARAGKWRREALLAEIAAVAPALGDRLRCGRAVEPVRGAVRLPNVRRRAHGPGWALVGDAGYHRDPITGHGITDAFRDAELLGEALGHALTDSCAGARALSSYETLRDAASQHVFRLTEQLVAFPAPARFAGLQRELGDAFDDEAALLASRPAPAGLRTATAV